MTPFAKLLPFFSPADRLRIVGLTFMVLIGAGLEMIGIGLVFPFVTVLQNPSAAASSRYLAPLHQALGSPEFSGFLIWLGVGLVAVYFFKNAYLGVMALAQHSFAQKKRVDLAGELFGSYLSKPYVFHLNQNSAELVRNLSIEVSRTINNVLMAGIRLASESAVTIGIMVLLLLVDPLTASAAFLFLGITGGLFYLVVRRKLAEYGKRRLEHQGKFIQEINHGLGGVKEIKVLGTERYFLDRFNYHSERSASAYRFHETLNKLPRLFFETVAVVALVGIIVLLLGQGRDLQGVVPTISLFAAAAFRLMPSINSIQHSINSIRFYSGSVDVIVNDLSRDLDGEPRSSKDLAEIREGHQLVPRLQERIEISELVYKYPDSEIPALEGVNLDIQRGQAVGLVGKSGAGKTTLVNILLGLLAPVAGEIRVDGVNVFQDIRSWQDQIGYIPQSIYLIDDTLRRNIALGLPDGVIDEDKVWDACVSARIEEFISDLPKGLETIVGERGVRLSGGQLQRIGIARALYRDPEVLVMDEPTTSLDKGTEKEILEAFEALKATRTIVVIAHRQSSLQICEYFYVLSGGEVVESGWGEELRRHGTEFMKTTADLVS